MSTSHALLSGATVEIEDWMGIGGLLIPPA
jgi:hypothetical protein